MPAFTMTDLMTQLASDPWRGRLARRIELVRRQLQPLCRAVWQLLESGHVRALLGLLMVLLTQVIMWLRRELDALASACLASIGMHSDVESTARRFGKEPEHIVDLMFRLEQRRRAQIWIASQQTRFLEQQKHLQAQIAVQSFRIGRMVGMGLLLGIRAHAMVDAITRSAAKPARSSSIRQPAATPSRRR